MPKKKFYLQERYSFEGSSQLYEKLVSSRVRGSGFIVPSSEREPLDQTDIDWTVILDPLGRWNIICEKSPDWSTEGGGCPGPQGGRPGPGPFRPPLCSRGFWSLLDGRKLRGALLSLCNPDMWPFLPYFLITPCKNR